MMALRPEFKSGLIASGIGLVLGGVFFASVKEVSKTEAYGYGGVLLYSSLVSATLGLVTTGAHLAVGGDEKPSHKTVKPVRTGDAIALPMPVDNMSRLGGTTDERVLSTLSYDVATGRAKTELLVDGLRELNRFRSGTQLPHPPLAEEVSLPLPPQEHVAVRPAPRYTPPVIEHPNPPVVEPKLYGMEEEDLWCGPDSMSGYDDPEEEIDIFDFDETR